MDEKNDQLRCSGDGTVLATAVVSSNEDVTGLPVAYAAGPTSSIPSSSPAPGVHVYNPTPVPVVQDAVAYPSHPGPINNSHQDTDQRIAAGSRQGRLQARAEVQQLTEHNRTVAALSNHAEIKVDAGQQHARVQNYLEETGQTQTSATTAAVSSLIKEQAMLANAGRPHQDSVASQATAGTFGREYTTAEYETAEYKTANYDTSEYKSLYEP